MIGLNGISLLMILALLIFAGQLIIFCGVQGSNLRSCIYYVLSLPTKLSS